MHSTEKRIFSDYIRNLIVGPYDIFDKVTEESLNKNFQSHMISKVMNLVMKKIANKTEN